MMEEVWKWVPGFEGKYEVSSYGNIRSYINRDNREPLVMRFSKCKNDGYIPIGLLSSPSPNRKYKRFRLHQIVMLAFVGECPDGKQIRHINGDKSDNRLVNLEYVTPKENMQDQFIHGTRAGGTRRFNTEDYIKVKRLRDDGHTILFISKEMGTSIRHVTRILNQYGYAKGK